VYDYDDNGNRLSLTNPSTSSVTLGSYDDQDRVMAYGSYEYTFNENGDLTSKFNTATSEETTYEYDARGALLSVVLPDSTFIEYVIDGQGRRIGKKVNGVAVQGFLYKDDLRIAAELDGAGIVVSQFTYVDDDSHSPDFMLKGGTVYRILKDQLGSPRVIVNVTTGTVAQRLEYDEFGNVLSDSEPGFQLFGFAGGLYDENTGLLRFGARDYDSSIGKWTNKDPIRWGGGQENLYSYSQNDPINRHDPAGLASGLATEADCPRSTKCGTSNCFLSEFSDRPCPTCPDIIVDGYCTYLCSNSRGDTNGYAVILLFTGGAKSAPICSIDKGLCEQ
jgi:RHS repeat-associated protein